MLRRTVFVAALLFTALNYAPFDAGRIQTASESAIKVIQRSQAAWYQKQACTSCHHQLVPEVTLKLARERGVAFDAEFARRHTSTAFAGLKDLDEAVQGAYFIDVYFDAFTLVSASIAGVSPTLPITASAIFVARRQLADGSWSMMDDRPPQAFSPFAATAYGVRAVREYLPEELKGEREQRVTMARNWLLNNAAKTTEDRISRLFGLSWTAAPAGSMKDAEKALLSEQRDDGGWSQLPYLSSDAYTTGRAMLALRESGYATSQPAYQKGIAFLLNNQKPDGSWHVRSRLHPPAPVSPPYFESQFPYEHDQFVSIMGTSWAAAALLEALPSKQTGVESKPPKATLTATKSEGWIRTALIGTPSELKKALDEGMSPNSKTSGGTTALMLAAGDPEKVKILLDRGARVDDRANSGFTALMVASRYRGNVQTLKLLLARGARPVAGADFKVTNEMSAMFMAAAASDVDMVEALTNAGSTVNTRAHVLGVFYATPLLYATFLDDAPMVTFLLKKGADPNEVDSDGVSVLSWSVVSNHPDIARMLIRAGAQVNRVDTLGMTPLLYGASIDYGDTAALEALMTAGADIRQKDKQGRTALELAEVYKHGAAANLLRGRTAQR